MTNILDKADDVEPTYTDDSIGIQEPEHGACEVQRDGMVIYIGMLERYNAYKHTKSTDIFWNILCVYVYAEI